MTRQNLEKGGYSKVYANNQEHKDYTTKDQNIKDKKKPTLNNYGQSNLNSKKINIDN